MQFRRLDENTVRCILSQEDMEERGLEFEDFFTDKDKTKNFLEDIVRQAQEEVGYEASSESVAMQVMPLPDNRLALTFSEKNDMSLKSMLGNIKSALEELKPDTLDDMIEDICRQEKEEKTEQKDKKKSAKKKNKKVFFRVYKFMDMEMAEQFSMTIPEDVSIKSQLYKNVEENVYYLTIEKGRLSMKDLEQYCACATEFSELVTKEQSYIQYCKELYKCIIKKGAIKVLRELAI